MKTSQKSAKGGVLKEIKRFGDDFSDELIDSGKDAIGGAFDDFASQLFGAGPSGDTNTQPRQPGMPNPDMFAGMKGNEAFGPMGFGKQEKKEPKRPRKIEVVFNRVEFQQERAIMSELKGLMNQVKQEIELLKKQDSGLLSDVSKMSVEELPEKAGIYHLRFLEFVVKLLKNLRQKISEGRMWLQTTFDKKGAKKHRGRAKKLGTQFSMSKELTQSTSPG